MAKDCKKLKKEKEIRKCYKHEKVKHLVKNCRTKEIKNKSIQEEPVSGTVHTRGESPQDGLRDMQTCGTTLASAYMLCHLSVT